MPLCKLFVVTWKNARTKKRSTSLFCTAPALSVAMVDMERLTILPVRRALAVFFFMLVAALLLAVIFRPGDQTAAAVTLGDPTAWIEHGIDGELLQINARTGEVTTRIDVAESGDDFVAVPHADGAVVFNNTTGVLSLVDGAELEVVNTTELSLTEGAEERDIELFGQLRIEDDIFVIDEDQILQVDSSTGFETPIELASPIGALVQDPTGTILGLDAARSAVVRVASDGASPFAEVNEPADEEEDGRELVRAGERVFALDPARLSMSEVLPEGVLGEPICMSSSAIGALHGGTSPGEESIVFSLNPEQSMVAFSTASGTCGELEVEIPDGEYGTPVAYGDVLYLPFFEDGRITTIDLDSGQTIANMGFGFGGPFELEVIGSTVWANDRSGPFAAVVESNRIQPIAKISAVIGEAGDIIDEGDGISVAPGGVDESGPRFIGDSGASVFEPRNDGSDTAADGTGTVDTGEVTLDEIALNPEPEPEPEFEPEAFGIAVELEEIEEQAEVEQIDLEELGEVEGDNVDVLGEIDELPELDSTVEPEAVPDTVPEVELVEVPDEGEEDLELVELEEGLTANFSISAAEVPVGQVVRLTDASVGAPVNWSWTFGDGTSADTPTVEKEWGEEGEYEVLLTVTNASGATSTRSTTILVVPDSVILPPNADFQFSSDTIEVGDSVTFESRTVGDADLLEWDFGNGRTGVGEEVTHTFEEAGRFRVVLTASNEAGETTSNTVIDVVAGVEPPVAAIDSIPEVVVTGQFVTLESVSLNDPTRIDWRFGDGNNATGTSVRHSWSEPGEYRIILTVENSEGTDRTVADITVEARVVEPVSSFTESDTSVLVGESIRFSDTSINNPDQLVWNFDDGTTSNAANPTHSWDRAGTYRVTLRAINDAGADRSGVTITVIEPIDPPDASFTVDSNVVATGSDVRFTDTSTNNPEEWLWDFENSGTATNPDPFRRWPTAGTYTVRLTVTNEGGRSSSRTEIRVIDPPTASFRFEMVDDDTVRFFDQSRNATAWQWNFGDGSTSNQQNPTHDFDGGVFNVTLTTSNEVATAGPAGQRVTIAEPPVAVATCRADGNQLICASNGSERASSFQWSAEDAVSNSTPNGSTTTFTFDRSLTPDVTLRVTSDAGLTDTTTIQGPAVEQGQAPRVLSVRIAAVDGDLVRLDAEFDRDPTSWRWGFDGVELVSGGDTSSPIFRVPGNGTYSGQVQVTNAFGQDTDPVQFRIDSIEPEPEPIRPPRVLSVRVAAIDGDLVRLDAEFDRDPTGWQWSVNGAQLVSGGDTSSPIFQVPGDGTYTGQVIASNEAGQDRDPLEFLVTGIDPPPPPPPPEIDASFTWQIISPGVVQFVNTSTAPPDAVISFRFDGAEEIIDDDENRPVIRYPDEGGTFGVLLVVRDDISRDTARQNILVPPVN